MRVARSGGIVAQQPHAVGAVGARVGREDLVRVRVKVRVS